MNITTSFNLADTAYIIAEAIKGNLMPVIIEKIKVKVETLENILITYQVSNTDLYHNTEFEEADLISSYEDAKALAESALEDEILEIQNRIDNL